MADSEQRAAPAAGSPPEPQSLGTTLKKARIARDLSLEQVSTELRIEVQQLDALEQDRFERIGVPVFIKGYIRQYGTFLGLDVRDLLAQYYKQNSLKEIQIQPSKTITLRDERQITTWIVAALILAALVVALGVWWWSGGRLPGSVPAPVPQTSAEPAAPAPAAAGVADAASAPAPASAPPPAPAPAATTAADTTAANATAASPPIGAAGPSPVPLPAALVAAPAAPQDAAATSPRLEPESGEPFVNDGRGFTAALDVVFEQESWAEISDARGQRLFYDMGAAGRTVKLSGEPPFAVVLGNSAGVKIALDGEDFPVPTSGRPGDYSRFSVDLVEE
jgi:cytoskeleton protein RodZ